MPSPDRNSPFSGLPVFGTIVPMAAAEPAPRSWPVSGFLAWRLVPEHGFALLTQPAAYNTGAWPWLHFSGRKFDAWPSESVLRLLVHEAHAVVERELAVHFPVVLDVALGVVVQVSALDVSGQLVIRA